MAGQIVTSQAVLAPFRAALAKAHDSFQAAIPKIVAKILSPDRLIKITMATISREPKLQVCSLESILRSCMQAAELGLEPSGGVLGQAYLVPFRNNRTGKDEAQLIVGYRGMITLARRSEDVLDIDADVVCDGDYFQYIRGSDPKLIHAPAIVDRGPFIAVYALAWLRGMQHPHVVVLTRDEVLQVRQASRARDSGPWVTWFNEMAKKTAIRRLCKLLPMSVELVRALDIEDAAEADRPDDDSIIDGGELQQPPPAARKTSRLAQQIAARQALEDMPPADDEPPPPEVANDPPPANDASPVDAAPPAQLQRERDWRAGKVRLRPDSQAVESPEQTGAAVEAAFAADESHQGQ